MEQIFKNIKEYLLIIIIGILIIVSFIYNNKIEKLKKELEEKPTIEYVTKIERDTIEIDKPVPIEIIKWKSSPTDTLYKPLDLSKNDSARIAQEYVKLYSDYAETKIYDDILKDDSLALIRVVETVQYNSIFGRKLYYEHRTPTVYITNTNTVVDRTTSIVGGMTVNNGINLGVGLVTGKNSVYLFNYNPIENRFGGSIYLPIKNF